MPILRSRLAITSVCSIAAVAVAVVGFSQGAAPPSQRSKVTLPLDLNDPKYGTLHLTTRLGSFALRDGIGRVEISFTGTVLVSQLDGKIRETSGQIRKEFDAHDRQAYFGTGRIVLEGAFRKVQWFGKSMAASWRGAGIAQIYGEFDKDLQTGYYWFDSNPEKMDWGTYGLSVELPERRVVGTGKPVPRPGKPGG